MGFEKRLGKAYELGLEYRHDRKRERKKNYISVKTAWDSRAQAASTGHRAQSSLAKVSGK